MSMIKVEMTVSKKGLNASRVGKAIREAIDNVDSPVLSGNVSSLSCNAINTKPSRAERLSDACSMAEEAKNIVEELAGEMRDWKDNLPESLQDSEKGDSLEEAASALEELHDNLDACDFESVEFPGMY